MLIIFFLASFSVTFGFIHSPLAEPIRNLLIKVLPEKYHMITECPHCSGTWIALFLSVICYFIVPQFPAYYIFLLPLASGAVNLLLYTIYDYIDVLAVSKSKEQIMEKMLDRIDN